MTVTASIVVHGSDAGQLRRALLSLAADRCDAVWIIDNGPDTGLEAVAAEFAFCRYRRVENRGFGAGHNIAIREATAAGSDCHLVMNADVVWHSPVIAPMAGYMAAHPEVALMGPKVFYPDGDLQYSCRLLPTPFDLVLKRFLPAALTRRRMRRYLLADRDHDRPFPCRYLLGSFLFFRTGTLAEAGGFDERFFMYPEDIDISRRLADRGTVLYWPEVSIVHEHAAASRRSLRMLRIHMANMVRYFNKWGWFHDPARRRANRTLLQLLPPAPHPAPPGRG